MTAALVALVSFILPPAQANDAIFPAQPAAQGAVSFDGRGFLINGQRTFIASAGMEYARVPRELWADRLLRFKRGGFDCTEFYAFWNYHEPQSGQFDFAGNRDLDAYLKLARSFGLYAIARVGPYYCAEWDNGGYPVWLRSVPDLRARTHNAPFEQYASRFWSHLLPIVFTNQINYGGNVILVQLENEHSGGWGTDGLNDPYFQFLQNTALADGLQVPYFFSGLHHASDPAGDHPFGSAGRKNPWFSTEFWCDWYDKYGETPAEARDKDWDTWKIIAYGGNGYNYYMAHGGSNFDYFNNDEDAASYDYGAAVGQTGDLYEEYYKFKRAAWFARSFQNILETSDDATGKYSGAATNSSVAVTARTSDAGTILFLANPGKTVASTRVTFNGVSYPQAGSLTVNPREIMPVVTGCSLLPGVTLAVAPARILGLTQQADTTTMVIYGQAGSPAELYFNVPADTLIAAGNAAFTLTGTNLALKTTCPVNGADNFSFQAGSRRMRILVVNDRLADDTWFVDVDSQNYVVVGPQYVGTATVTNGYLQLVTEIPWENAAGNAVSAYGPGDSPILLSAITTPDAHPGTATLTAWQTASGSAQADPNYDTTQWLSDSSGPQQMGADGDVSCYAWYRTAVNVPSLDAYTFCFGTMADHILPFVDGIAVTASNVTAHSFTTTLNAGSHTIAIFTSHYGRNKLIVTDANISQMYEKGLNGPAYLFGGAAVSGPVALTNWNVMPTTRAAVGTTPPPATAPGWSRYAVGADAFNGQPGYAWFQTTLPTIASAGAEMANFASVDDIGWVYLNGTLVASNAFWNNPFIANLGGAWLPGGTNLLSVLVQNTAGVGGLDQPVTFTAYPTGISLTDWVQKGGPGDPDPATGWQTLDVGQKVGGPRFFRASFTAAPPETVGADPMWRVSTTGLSHGSVWVNGHNLGRYPEMIAAPGIYIPECWLKAGSDANTLVIYDEAGNQPTEVRVQPEIAASRDVVLFQSDAKIAR